jgi:predicted lipoprotein with Yx(FWY)xxD motif
MRPTNRPSRIGFLTVIGGLALVLAACSSTGASKAPSAAAPTAAPPASAGGGGAVVLATSSGAVGDYLTGADGKTLYIFTKDSAGKPSVCVDACATKWPPLVVTGDAPAAPAGVTGALTTIARADGSMQLALNGSPLYYYAPDTKAGDTTGEGVGGVWFVARPDGSLPSAAPSAASAY